MKMLINLNQICVDIFVKLFKFAKVFCEKHFINEQEKNKKYSVFTKKF